MLRKHLPKLIGVVILLFLFSVLLIPDLALARQCSGVPPSKHLPWNMRKMSHTRNGMG